MTSFLGLLESKDIGKEAPEVLYVGKAEDMTQCKNEGGILSTPYKKAEASLETLSLQQFFGFSVKFTHFFHFFRKNLRTFSAKFYVWFMYGLIPSPEI